MAVYKIFPTKDASLYSMFATMNTGIDPISQVSNLNLALSSSPSVARNLIYFDTAEIEDVLNNKKEGTWEAYLKSNIATAQGINEDSELYIYPLAQDWNNGTGTYLDQPITTDGASWATPAFDGSNVPWSQGNPTTPISSSRTDSYTDPKYAVAGGGVWFTTSSYGAMSYPYTKTFSMRSDKDLDMRVTNTVHDWYSGSIGNYGFIMKWEETIEFNPNKQIQPVLQYYSIDTNTIYPPSLEFRWDDYLYQTSSNIQVLSGSSLYINLDENPGMFYSESINRFRLNVREEYPKRVFQTSSIYTTQHYLPTSSYYAIQDLDTNEYVVGFDKLYTKISADDKSNYFDIYMNGLEPERYYKILIQVDNGTSSKVYDNDYYFKVVNG